METRGPGEPARAKVARAKRVGHAPLRDERAFPIRPEDHALLQPMFTASLEKSGDGYTVKAGKTLDPQAVAPPVSAFK